MALSRISLKVGLDFIRSWTAWLRCGLAKIVGCIDDRVSILILVSWFSADFPLNGCCVAALSSLNVERSVLSFESPL